jgi:hypothetical protein
MIFINNFHFVLFITLPLNTDQEFLSCHPADLNWFKDQQKKNLKPADRKKSNHSICQFDCGALTLHIFFGIIKTAFKEVVFLQIKKKSYFCP